MTEPSQDQQVIQAIKLGIAATTKGDHATALKVFRAVYDNPALKAPPDGLSCYGLSIAVAENQTARGIQLCRDAIGAQFFDDRHHENLVRIHLHKGNRTSAVSALEEGLKNAPNSSRLATLQKELGIATAPVPKVSSPRGRLDLKSLSPVVTLLVGAAFFAVVFGITFYIAYQQAYGP